MEFLHARSFPVSDSDFLSRTPLTLDALTKPKTTIARWPAQTIATPATPLDHAYAVSTTELKMRATAKTDSQLVGKLPPDTHVSVVAESKLRNGKRRVKIAYSKDGQTKQGWVSWKSQDKKEILSPVVSPCVSPSASPAMTRKGRSPSATEFVSPTATSSPASSLRKEGSPSSTPSHSPGRRRKGGADVNFPVVLDDAGPDDDESFASFRKAESFAYRPGWSQRSEELRHSIQKNMSSHYRSEDELPETIELTGKSKLPVTASFKNRSDRRMARLVESIEAAKLEAAEGGKMKSITEGPAVNQWQHVLRHRMWRTVKQSLNTL